jgi:hypothetical protein
MKTLKASIVLLSLLVCSSYCLAQRHFMSPNADFISIKKTSIGVTNVMQLVSLKSPWSKTFNCEEEGEFTDDGKSYVCKIKDTLKIQKLGSNKLIVIPNVRSYQGLIFNYIAYTLENKISELFDLSTDKKTEFKDSDGFYYNSEFPCFICKQTNKAFKTSIINFFSLKERRNKIIYSGQEIEMANPVFGKNKHTIAFFTRLNSANVKQIEFTSLWIYNEGDDKAKMMVSPELNNLDNGEQLLVQDAKFTPDCKHMVFYKSVNNLNNEANKGKFKIWSYTDFKLRSYRIKDENRPRISLFSLSMDDGGIRKIGMENDLMLTNHVERSVLSNKYALINSYKENIFAYDTALNYRIIEGYSLNEFNWNQALKSSVFLVDLTNGDRESIREDITPNSNDFEYQTFSEDGKYVVFFDTKLRCYFSYNIISHQYLNLTKDAHIETTVGVAYNGLLRNSNSPMDIITILEDSSVILQDRYSDIWKVSINNRFKPQNITNSYGRIHNSFLTPINMSLSHCKDFIFNIIPNESFRTNGYAKINLLKGTMKIILPPDGDFYSDIKEVSIDNNYFIINRYNSKIHNYFFSKNCVSLKPISFNKPSINTIDKQVIKWKDFDGHDCYGVLFLPKYFNNKKQYPVIISYYEKDVNGRALPSLEDNYDPNDGIDGFSPGYIHFFPSIDFEIGHPGRSVYNCVISGTQKIIEFPFVDSTKIGIWGASWGGYETNYLVTHSKIFAAAYSNCGVSNFLSSYGLDENDPVGYSHSATAELGQQRMGATPWQRLDLYIENSPIFWADKITTPLLLSHCESDFRVPFSQSLEFYKALRRLGKTCWLIAGNGCKGHSDPARKYHRNQFFDHYLKGALAPEWMLTNLTAKEKESGLGLNLSKYALDTIAKLHVGNELSLDEQLQILKKTISADSLLKYNNNNK